MTKLVFRLSVATLTFILGVIVTFPWRSNSTRVDQTPTSGVSIPTNSAPVEAERLCEVHGIAMHKQHVPIVYGFAAISEPYELWSGYYKAHQTQFPNTNRYVAGGCVIDRSVPNDVYVCMKCREAEALWVTKARNGRK